MAENLFNKFNESIRDVQNDKIKSIVIGLFVLLGFIIFIYSIVIGIVSRIISITSRCCFCRCDYWVFYFGRNNYR